jgi:TonB-dependent starch-binding outer membrane protein SusC
MQKISGLLALALLLLWAPALQGLPGPESDTPTPDGLKQTGTIAGQILEEGTGQGMSGVQVSVEGTGIGTVSGANGAFQLTDVPAGEVEVVAQMIGFASQSRTVQLQAGETVQLEFMLSPQALDLDEIVVTGTAGGTQRRALGASLSSIDAASLTEVAPVTSMEQLLQGRAAGVVGLGSTGTVGATGSLNLRGITSLTQGAQPLIYIDGIRLETSRGMVSSGEAVSRLADVNLQDIDRVEVIRGAAASTLYGSEASSGVIQIFTKSGAGSDPVYSVSTRMGANQVPQNFPLMHPDPQYPSANDILETGLYYQTDASVRGSAGMVNYFLSGTHSSDEGSVPGNFHDRSGIRMNLGLSPAEGFEADFRTNFVRSQVGTLIMDNVTTSVLGNIMLGNPVELGSERDPYGGAFMPIDHALEQIRQQDTYRFIGGSTLSHRMGDRFTHRLTMGLDFAESEQLTAWPYSDELSFPRSQRNVTRERNIRTNLDYAGTVLFGLGDRWDGEFAFGAQLAQRDQSATITEGLDFAAPGLELLGGTAQRDAGESELNYATGGFFLQQQMGYQNRIFLTGGLRVDGSSAFGDDFGLQPYPKISGSWVISESDWFHLPWVSSLRLRGGLGMAGMQPGAFDAQRTYEPFNHVGGQVAIRQATLGNPDLAPEVSREFEAGFEGSFFEERIDLEFTFYDQSTSDLLVSRSFPASAGFTANQLTNVGEMQNRGIELTLNGVLHQRPGLEWRAGATYSFNSNEMVSLDGLSSIQVDRFGTWIVEGYEVPSKWGIVSEGTDENGMPIPSAEEQYIGPAMPPHNGSFRTDVTWNQVSFFANAQWAVGHYVTYLGRPFMINSATGEEYYRTLMEAGGDPDAPEVQALRAQASCCPGDFVEPGDWLKLREIGASYTVPSEWLGGGDHGRSLRVFASGRNLLTFTGYSGTDPEIGAQFGDDETGLRVSSEFFSLPQRRQLLLGLDLGF